jgi:biotin--protein ligase
LEKDEDNRNALLKACLAKLGLEVNNSTQLVPSPSPLHLTFLEESSMPSLLERWKEIMVKTEAGLVIINGENDVFSIKNIPDGYAPSAQKDITTIEKRLASLTLPHSEQEAETVNDSDRIVDYDKIIKHIQIHGDSYPTIRETPKFNHQNFYLQLERYAGSRLDRFTFGKHLLYAEVITSTSTILEKYVTAIGSLFAH